MSGDGRWSNEIAELEPFSLREFGEVMDALMKQPRQEPPVILPKWLYDELVRRLKERGDDPVEWMRNGGSKVTMGSAE